MGRFENPNLLSYHGPTPIVGEHKTKYVEILDIFGKFMPQRALGGPVAAETWISMPPRKGHPVYKKWLNFANQNLADFGDG